MFAFQNIEGNHGKEEKVNALTCAPNDVGPLSERLYEAEPRITKIEQN